MSVLLVPTEAYREALIGDGPCGSVPPLAVYRPMGGWQVGLLLRQGGYGREPMVALVLAWEGEPLPDGLARLAQADGGLTVHGWDLRGLLVSVVRIAGRFGRVVLLDADGQEVTS